MISSVNISIKPLVKYQHDLKKKNEIFLCPFSIHFVDFFVLDLFHLVLPQLNFLCKVLIIRGGPKKRPIASFSLNLFQRSNHTFSESEFAARSI